MTLEVSGIDKAISELTAYRNRLPRMMHNFLNSLARIGINVAHVRFKMAVYDGNNDVSVSSAPVWISDNELQIQATGTAVLFIEFGSGAMFGWGHPNGYQFGMIPGSWSMSEQGKGHWDDPNGWYYEHGKVSYGNAPARAMYEAWKQMQENILSIARGAFV